MKKFKECVKFFKKKFPQYKIFVRRIKLKTMDGYCKKINTNTFIIKINKDLTEKHSIDVLIHEISHIPLLIKNIIDHNDEWGISYANIYRIHLNEFLNQNNSK